MRPTTLSVLGVLVLLTIPMVVFGTYVMVVKRWSFRRQVPYAVGYVVAISLLGSLCLYWFVGVPLEFTLPGVVIAGLGGWFGMNYWARALESIQRSASGRKE